MGFLDWLFGKTSVSSTQEKPSPLPTTITGYNKQFREFYQKLGWKVFEIADSNSMDPVFDAGHLLVGEPYTQATSLAIGDIVVWGDRHIVHRIIALEQTRFKTLGDNNARDDGWQLKSAITHVVRVISYTR